MTVDQATTTLEAAGFSVTVGDAVDGVEAAGTIVQQDPAAGKVGGGTTVTINPSNGNGLTVPAVSGTLSSATQTLRSAGFSDISSSCTQRDSASDEGTVTGTDPSAGTVVSRSASITINYQAKSCGNSNRGNNNGNNG